MLVVILSHFIQFIKILYAQIQACSVVYAIIKICLHLPDLITPDLTVTYQIRLHLPDLTATFRSDYTLLEISPLPDLTFPCQI